MGMFPECSTGPYHPQSLLEGGKSAPFPRDAIAASTLSLGVSNQWAFSYWLLCWGILLIGTFFLASIQGGHPVSLVTREMSRICVFTAPRQKMVVWNNADWVHFRQ